MSINIRYGTRNGGPGRWEKRKEPVFTTNKKYRPDVIGLPEDL